MAITGIDTIEGKQIIAAGAVSAKSAEMAYNDENGNPITGYLTAVPAGTMNESAFSYDASDNITAYNGSAFKAGGEFPQSASEALNVVTSNSASWDEISAYIASSASYITSLPSDLVYTGDITGKQDITGMTAYATRTSVIALIGELSDEIETKLDKTASGNFYTTANESGFITGVPAGTMNESGFSYDASDNITAYNGSAFKAGDEFPQSATDAIETVTANSADWNGTTDTVSSNSGAWGGSALPISAGPGIKFEMVNDTLVASTDETVLFFAGNDSSGVQAGDLTESIMNFERIRVAGMDNDGHVDVKYIYPAWSKNADNFNTTGYEVMLYGANPIGNTVWEKWTRYSFSALTSFNVVLSYEGSYTANSISDVTNNHKNSIREVVGINRIAGGN